MFWLEAIIEIIEEESGRLSASRRTWSVNASRQSLRTLDSNQLTVPIPNSPLAISLSSSKNSFKKKIKLLNPNNKRVRKSSAAIVLGKLRKKWYSNISK